MKLFRSHNPDFKDGEQLRDFIYVKDVVDVIIFMMQQGLKAVFITWAPGRQEHLRIW